MRSEVLQLNAGVNDRALETLKRGFAGNAKRRYLPEKDSKTRTVACVTLPDVTIHVLGPSRDPDAISDMNPPSSEHFLTLLGLSDLDETGHASIPKPFNSEWVDDRSSETLDRYTRDLLENIHDGLDVRLGVALDQALNNTSLVLMFVIGNVYLLFPGDAQWGTWREMMNDESTCRLLQKTTFYKVGHHGSQNATPVSFVNKCLGSQGGSTWAMVPVTSYDKWPEIPRKPLLDNIKLRTRYFVRSDDRQQANGFKKEGDWYVEASIPID
jgi:hypothetical protein